MTARTAVVAIVLAAAVFSFLALTPELLPPPRAAEARPGPRPPRPSERPFAPPEGTFRRGGGRNPFEYQRPPTPPPPPPFAPHAAGPVEMPSPLPTAPPVRLVGIVHRATGVKAALTVQGETLLLAAGEESGGYRVEGIQADGRVLLRTPDGSVLELVAPEG